MAQYTLKLNPLGDEVALAASANPVAVTGATGYVAGWVIKALLELGLTVHATVRCAIDDEKLNYLRVLADKSAGKIIFFQADLLNETAFLEVFAGCHYVFHTASPFIMDVKNPQKQLIEPAVTGTKNVLAQVNKIPSIKRVVLTSSCAAIYGDNADLQSIPEAAFCEKHWNTTSTIDHKPYSLSKTLAEKVAWEIQSQQKHWSLVCINPSLVVGPGIKDTATSGSFELFENFASGRFSQGVPDMSFGVVDVKDVAIAHVRAAFYTEVHGRYIVSAQSFSLLQISEMLRKHFPTEKQLPKRTLPKWLVKLVGPLVNRTLSRKVIERNVGHPFKASHEKSQQQLKMNYHPVEPAITEMYRQIITRV